MNKTSSFHQRVIFCAHFMGPEVGDAIKNIPTTYSYSFIEPWTVFGKYFREIYILADAISILNTAKGEIKQFRFLLCVLDGRFFDLPLLVLFCFDPRNGFLNFSALIPKNPVHNRPLLMHDFLHFFQPCLIIEWKDMCIS